MAPGSLVTMPDPRPPVIDQTVHFAAPFVARVTHRRGQPVWADRVANTLRTTRGTMRGDPFLL